MIRFMTPVRYEEYEKDVDVIADKTPAWQSKPTVTWFIMYNAKGAR